MSFLWYTCAGTIITWVVGIAVSHLTGAQDLEKLNLNLLAPMAKYLVPKKLRHQELQVYSTTTAVAEKNPEKEGTEWVWKNSQVVVEYIGDNEKEQLKQ